MAATITPGGELTFLSFPITKTEETDDGDLIVYGKATDGSVDSDEQIVDPDFSAKAIQDWLSSGANVRVQHNSQRDPAGVGIEVNIGPEGDTWVKSLVVEPVAQRLVRKGALRAYSVGIARPKIVRDSVARGGRIVDGQIVEISLVDRPANKNCGIQLVKSDSSGNAEWVGKVFGDSDVLTKAEDTGTIDLEGTTVSSDTVSVDLPKNASITFSPTDLAKLLEHRRIAEERTAEKRQMDPDVGGGVDRDKIPSEDFAGRNRSFPIVKPGDVSDAASSIGRAGPSNYSSDKLKANIIRIARRKGDAFVAELPESWKSEMSGDLEKSHEDSEVEKEKKPAFEGAAPSFDHDPAEKDGNPSQDDGEDDTEDDDDDDKPSAKKGMKDCPKCGKGFDADAKTRRCDDCDAKLPSSAAMKAEGGSCAGCGKGLDDDDKFCSNCGKKAPGGGDMNNKSDDSVEKGKPTPGEGVVGSGAAAIDPVPAHREPDGDAVEAFEHDAGLPTDADNMSDTGGGISEIPKNASLRMKAIGSPVEMGALHDLTCPVFHPATADKAHPGRAVTDLDTSFWQQKALDAAVSAPIDAARHAAQIWQYALSLKSADPVEIASIREEVHKAFQDANPGPGSFPTPGELSPKKFNRPYQTDGRARPSATPSGTTHGTIPTGDVSADDFGRGPLTSGHAEISPSNKGATAIIEPAPLPPGMSRTYYRNAEREAARSAMQSMHDHIAQTFPDLCAMNGPGTNGNPPTGERPVPLPVGAQKSEDEPVTEKSVNAEKLAKKVAKGRISLDEAREKLGLAPLETPETVVKAASVIDADSVKSAVLEATSDLVAQLAEVTKALNTERARTDKLQDMVDSLGDLPDPHEAPFRGVAQNALTANKSVSGLPAGARTVAETAEQAQQSAIREMYNQWRNSPDPALREAAESYLFKMAGLPTANK